MWQGLLLLDCSICMRLGHCPSMLPSFFRWGLATYTFITMSQSVRFYRLKYFRRLSLNAPSQQQFVNFSWPEYFNVLNWPEMISKDGNIFTSPFYNYPFTVNSGPLPSESVLAQTPYGRLVGVSTMTSHSLLSVMNARLAQKIEVQLSSCSLMLYFHHPCAVPTIAYFSILATYLEHP